MMQQTQPYHPPRPSASARATYAPCSLPRPSHYKRTVARAKETQGVVTYLLKLLTLLLLLLSASTPARANNILVSNSKVVINNKTFAFIEFNLSWENSWRVANLGHDVGNWDAAWVFVKYREVGGDWQHAWLSANNSHHDIGAGTPATINIGTTDISGTDRGMGAFIYRSANGSGTFSVTNARLQWNFADQGVDDLSPIEIRVFAIEMVYVSQGAFFVGTGANPAETGSFTNGSWTSGATIPLSISSEDALIIGQFAGNLWGTSSSGNSTIGGSGTLPAAFPKGYAAFYMMKYSISQQQYVDFLNTLTRTQQQERFSSTTVGNFMHSSATQTTPINRNGVRLMSDPGGSAPRVFGCDLNNNGTAGEAADGQWIAMNWISWMDGAAYVDWSGLRPMTELEYEKAARGPANPVANEYAWGSTITAATGISNAGANNETASNAGANAVSSNQAGVQGPLRVGAFAKAGTTRAEAGASYWGIMELSGNLWERPVTVGNVAGRSFTGLHGNGELNNAGAADVNHWPGINGNTNTSGANAVYGGTTGVTQTAGSGWRGGSWNNTPPSLGVSDRSGATGSVNTRLNGFGIRGVRSAPAAGVGE